MQLNKIIKGVFIALPVVTLMACSSSTSSSDAEAARNASNSSASSSASGSENTGVEVGTVVKEKSPEEIRQEQKEALMRNQVVYFDFDRSSVNSEFYSLLNEHAEFLRNNPSQRVTIEGHCDKRGTPEYNIALGERRAKSVETFMQNAGVSASQISVVSYGEEKPVAMGDTERAFKQNRRAVLVYN
ncbi:peptidoglycan-associated lipoprotein Pal [Planctobacterium marinum]|uniref:Peptidoglycan-associated lipoprotein n=1 Tax=Planctobacterium marinum TaxID=1631968 RepID=A0AA48HRD0_9ALTE|nr:peptidoglycan-associated lipoprotein [Planctobacterium marinum]